VAVAQVDTFGLKRDVPGAAVNDLSSLNLFRHRLRKLAWSRRVAQWTCGLSVSLYSLFWLLGLVLLLDLIFQLDLLQRLTVLSVLCGTWGWLLYRYARPHFPRRESEVELALLLEHYHDIDTDLVAAIEFAGPGSATWGSATLRGKVISDVAQLSNELDVRRGVDRSGLRRHLAVFAATLTLLAIIVVLLPQHMAVFLNRLALGNDHYPSRTAISEITVNRQRVYTPEMGAAPRDARCAEHSPVVIQVHCTRHAPQLGELRILAPLGAAERQLTLHRRESAGGADAVFTARLPALLESLEYQVYLGDAWTEPAAIEMIPLPQIELRVSATPPSYTNSDGEAGTSRGSYRVTVIEGSRIELGAVSINGKKLQSVEVDLQIANQTLHKKLTNVNGDGTQWRLSPETLPVFASLRSNVQFTVTAVDADGLRPLRSLTGEIRLQSDMPPDVAAATIHRVVLPEARPQIAYRVYDDFGIARLRLRIQTERSGNETAAAAEETTRNSEATWLDINDLPLPIPAADLPYRNRYVLDLEPWGLRKGDRIRVMLQATDHRGTTGGDSAMSKPLYLEVSDRAGVLEAILEADHRTEKDLDEMIERQLGLEDLP
jgi:hypothetical protein